MDKIFVPVIGKDVIESLTLGMYEDSKFIFREYIQNAADQIDKAVKDGLLTSEQAEIHIQIDPENKIIKIEDNATGISSLSVQAVLQNIAQSTKQRGVDKGFRGIGRLGGLAYCENLVFETSYPGQNTKSILTWDAALLKRIINNRNDKQDAASVIKEVTTFTSDVEKSDAHYFKVILTGVNNEDLLDKKLVEDYLAMVAPLPFPSKFIFKDKIKEELEKEKLTIDEYTIYLNTDRLFKSYSTYIYEGEENNKRKVDEVIDIVFFKERNKRNELIYWGWYGVSMLNRQIKAINRARGFRLRKSNIEIGDEYTLLKLHRDNRFNFYFFGEVHAFHYDLIPNSRRDYFIENDIYVDFESALSAYFHTHIYKLCYTASEINSSLKKIEDLRVFDEEFKSKSEQGFTDKKEHQEYKERFEKKKEEAIVAKRKIEKIGQEANSTNSDSVTKILSRVASTVKDNEIETLEIAEDGRPKFRTDRLSSLNKEQRKFLGRVFSIIRDVLDTGTADDLIQKIEEELK